MKHDEIRNWKRNCNYDCGSYFIIPTDYAKGKHKFSPKDNHMGSGFVCYSSVSIWNVRHSKNTKKVEQLIVSITPRPRRGVYICIYIDFLGKA